MHLCQEGHLVVPTPLLPPSLTEMSIAAINKIRITLLEVKKNQTSAGEMAEAAQLAWCGLN